MGVEVVATVAVGTGVFVGTIMGGLTVGVFVGTAVLVGLTVGVFLGTAVLLALTVGVVDGTGVLVTGIETVGSGVVGTAINLGINTNTAKGITCPLLH
jgi:hypothetical protein